LRCSETLQCRVAAKSASSERGTPVGAQQRRGQPERFVAVHHLPGLALSPGQKTLTSGAFGRSSRLMKPSVRLTKVGDQNVRASVETMRSGANSRSKSFGLASSASKNGCHAATAAPAREALEHHRDLQRVVAAQPQLLAPVRADQTLRAEVERQPDQLAERRIRGRLDGQVDRAERLGQRMHAQGQSRDDAEVAATAALQGPEQIGWVQALARRSWPSAVTTSASSRLPAAVPNAFEKLPKPPLCTSPATPTVMQPPPCT
jgi:hypothetical protein